jgi:hypothetical protein
MVFGVRLKIGTRPGLVINEVRPGAVGEGFVEFFNTTDSEVNLRGHFLSDEVGNLRKMVVESDLLVPAGGLAVIAHPGRYHLTRARLVRLIREFRTAGGVALEVVTSAHNRDEMSNFARLAREQQMLASVGSDFHGLEHAWLHLGRLPALPEGCVPVWRDW